MNDKLSIIRWEDPPAAGRGDHWQSIASALRYAPAKWAVIGTYNSDRAASAVAYRIRSGKTAAFRPAGDYETCARKRDDVTNLYARYVGEAHA